MFHSLKSRETLDNSTSLIQLTVINKNILYLTHEVDKCVSMLRRMELDNKLQTQVNDFFPGPPSTLGDETSPQTDPDEQ